MSEGPFRPGRAAEGGAESRLHDAAFRGDTPGILQMLSEGDDPNWRDSVGEPALFGACGWGHASAVAALIAGGARHDGICQNGWTALHWAARGGLEVTRLLIEAGADPTAVNALGQRPVDVAQAHGKGEIVAYLKTVGPEIGPRRGTGSAPPRSG
ncbi:MAG: ankyrin repeat domain-containing protein [Pseudomonadota bacterium]